jgi:hypothetical protein
MKVSSILHFFSFCVLAGCIFLFNFPKASPVSKDKVVICGVCKDVATALPSSIESIERIGALFSDYRVFIYENNSSDDTPGQLKIWAQKNERVIAICEKLKHEELLEATQSRTWDKKPFRTELIARARNIVLEKALQKEFDDYKYVIMIDMDFSKKWGIKGISNSLNQNVEWDAICANGVINGNLYDRYAFRSYDLPLGPELLGDLWWTEQKAHPIHMMQKKSPLMPVYSAFGGLAIYKRSSIKGCRYSGTVTPELEVLTKQLIQEGKNRSNAQVLQYLNLDTSSLEITSLNNDSQAIRWLINSGGFHAPVCCEHVTFHAMMINNGHSKIFINPEMIRKY